MPTGAPLPFLVALCARARHCHGVCVSHARAQCGWTVGEASARPRRLSAGWVVCDHDGAPVSREVRHDVVCATCGVASVMVMRGSGRLLKIEYLFFIFVSCEG